MTVRGALSSRPARFLVQIRLSWKAGHIVKFITEREREGIQHDTIYYVVDIVGNTHTRTGGV